MCCKIYRGQYKSQLYHSVPSIKSDFENLFCLWIAFFNLFECNFLTLRLHPAWTIPIRKYMTTIRSWLPHDESKSQRGIRQDWARTHHFIYQWTTGEEGERQSDVAPNIHFDMFIFKLQ